MKFILQPAPHPARENCIAAVRNAPVGMCVEIKEQTRTLAQNAAQWPYLEAFSKQLQWPVNGQMVWMEPEDWKDVLTAVFYKETLRLAAGFDGGVVMLGRRTSKFKKGEFSEWIEFLKAAAAIKGVNVYEDEPCPA